MSWKSGKENPSWVETPIKDEMLLCEELFENKLSYSKIADKYGVNKTLVQKLVKKYGIKITLKDRVVGKYGENNPNWRGGPKFCSICGEIQIVKTANTCMGCYDKSGKNNPMYGKNHNRKSKTKMRKSAIKRIEQNKFNGGQMIPGYNQEACKIIEQYGNDNG